MTRALRAALASRLQFDGFYDFIPDVWSPPPGRWATPKSRRDIG
jgi:hypothetical protein